VWKEKVGRKVWLLLEKVWKEQDNHKLKALVHSQVTYNKKITTGYYRLGSITEIPEWEKYQDGSTTPMGVKLFFAGTGL
jgi:hypothetical protein